MDYDELEGQFSKILENKREDEIILSADFSVTGITPYLDDSEIKMGELAKISLILSLVKKYGKTKVEKDLKNFKRLMGENKDLFAKNSNLK